MCDVAHTTRSGPQVWDRGRSWSGRRFVVVDGVDDEEDETQDRRGAEGEDRAGGGAGAVDGGRPVAAIRGSPEPHFRLEKAA